MPANANTADADRRDVKAKYAFRDHKTKYFLGRGTDSSPNPTSFGASSPNLELALTPLKATWLDLTFFRH